MNAYSPGRIRLTGLGAIERSESIGLNVVQKYADSTDPGRLIADMSEAREIAHADPSLIYFDDLNPQNEEPPRMTAAEHNAFPGGRWGGKGGV